jgi:membrane protease YdiL (CAAX protease family)
LDAPPAKKRHSVAVTVILTVLIAASIAASVAKPSPDPIAQLTRPALTTTVAQERLLRLAAASDGGWWARLRNWSVDVPVRPLETAVDSYARALPSVAGAGQESAAVALHARRAVALAGLGRRKEAQADLLAAAGLSPVGAKVARVIGYALDLGGEGPSADRPSAAEREEALAALALPGTTDAGWTGDQIRLGFARRTGAPADAAAAQAGLARTGRVVARANVIAGIACAVLVTGVVLVLAAAARRRRLFPPLADAVLPPPWTLSTGYAMSIRAVALAFLLSGVVWLVASMVFRIESTGVGFIGAAVVVLPYLQRGLFVPHGLPWTAAFGLRPRAGWAGVLRSTLVLVALELVLAGITDVTGSHLGRQSPWTEQIDESLLTGNAFEVSSMVVAMVVCAPLIEETLFRGLLYGSLRTRLGMWPSALVSAALFSLAHGYSGLGTVTLFLGAVLWALVYESTRSLLPTLLDHATNNAFAAASDLVLR